ncbi:alpha/beta fold hydrolase [Nocardia jiangxiensis]|uniref:alpha/beta fold hydrolase n=1 Tax=Nocardia jiangxiensis TaxID=282685 RepID=UPI0002E94F41|nr:alpha/beta fold hydrolase [Nocardia jiangxiensis]
MTTESIWLDVLGTEITQGYRMVGGIRTRVLEAGDGPPLVFLHGGGGHAEAYIRQFAAHAPHFRCYAPDMLGHGFTDAPADGKYSTDDFGTFMADFLDTIGADRVHISGESFGGRVAAWVAMTQPDRVERLVLNTSGGLPVEEKRHEEDVEDLLARMTSALRDPSPETVRKRMQWLFADPTAVPEEFVALRQRIYSRPDVNAALHKLFRKLFDPQDQKHYVLTPERLASIKAPTLVVWTDHNPIHSFADAQRHLQHIPDVRFKLIENASHWPQYEQADEFNDLHIKFLLGEGD